MHKKAGLPEKIRRARSAGSGSAPEFEKVYLFKFRGVLLYNTIIGTSTGKIRGFPKIFECDFCVWKGTPF